MQNSEFDPSLPSDIAQLPADQTIQFKVGAHRKSHKTTSPQRKPEKKHDELAVEIKFQRGNTLDQELALAAKMSRVHLDEKHDGHAHHLNKDLSKAPRSHHPSILTPPSPERPKKLDTIEAVIHQPRTKLFDKNRGISGVIYDAPKPHSHHTPIRRFTISSTEQWTPSSPTQLLPTESIVMEPVELGFIPTSKAPLLHRRSKSLTNISQIIIPTSPTQEQPVMSFGGKKGAELAAAIEELKSPVVATAADAALLHNASPIVLAPSSPTEKPLQNIKKKAVDALFKDSRVRQVMQRRKLLVQAQPMELGDWESLNPADEQALQQAARALLEQQRAEAESITRLINMLPIQTLNNLSPEQRAVIMEQQRLALERLAERQENQRRQFLAGEPVDDFAQPVRHAVPMNAGSLMSIEIPNFQELQEEQNRLAQAQARAREQQAEFERLQADAWLRQALDDTLSRVWMEHRQTQEVEEDDNLLLSAKRRGSIAPQAALPIPAEVLQDLREQVWKKLLEQGDFVRQQAAVEGEEERKRFEQQLREIAQLAQQEQTKRLEEAKLEAQRQLALQQSAPVVSLPYLKLGQDSIQRPLTPQELGLLDRLRSLEALRRQIAYSNPISK